MKSPTCSFLLIAVLALSATTFTARSQNQPAAAAATEIKVVESKAKSDADQEKRAAEWAGSLKLGDVAKETRVANVIATHLKAVRDWHNDHPYTNVPAGINP